MTAMIGKGILALLWLGIYVKAWTAFSPEDDTRLSSRSNYNHLFSSLDFLSTYLDEAIYQSKKRKITSSYYRNLTILHGPKEGEFLFDQRIKATLRDVYLLIGLLIITLLWLNTLSMILGLAILGRIMIPRTKAEQEARELQVLLIEQMPMALMQLRLALESGRSLNQAWQEVANSSEEEIYRVMGQVLKEEKTGIGSWKAFAQFGDQYRLTMFRDLANLITHNLENGGKEIVVGLSLMQKDIYEKMKRAYRIGSEEAKQKMVFPSLLLFLGILIIVLLPALGRSL